MIKIKTQKPNKQKLDNPKKNRKFNKDPNRNYKIKIKIVKFKIQGIS